MTTRLAILLVTCCLVALPAPADARRGKGSGAGVRHNGLKKSKRPVQRARGTRTRRPRTNPLQRRMRTVRADFKTFAGVPMMSNRDVQGYLAQVPTRAGRGKARQTHNRRDGTKVTMTVVRTGTLPNGKPRGYVRGEWVDRKTGEKMTEYHSDSVSWARRGHGKGQATVVVNRKDVRTRSGRIARAAGTYSVVTRETLDKGNRTSLYTDRPDGMKDTRTITKLRNGRVERYYSSQSPDQYFAEQRIRNNPDGTWNAVSKTLDGGKIRVEREDSRGRRTNKVLSFKQARRQMDRMIRANDNPKMKQTRFTDGSWSLNQVTSSDRGFIATISARGKNGKLGAVKTGYVSWLGTRFGEVKDVKNQKAAARKPGARKVKSRTYLLNRGGGDGTPEPKADMSKVTRADRNRLGRSLRSYNKVTGQKAKARIHPSAGQFNAYVDVHDKSKVTTFGPGYAKNSYASQLGILGHEGQHERDGRGLRKFYKNSPKIRSGFLAKVGSTMAADLALLEYADMNRTYERRADAAAGKVLGQARKQTGQKSLSPRDLVKDLWKPHKGTPRNWSPYSEYDRHKDRGATMWKAYGKELRRTPK